MDAGTPRTCERYPQGFCISYGDLIYEADVDLQPRHAAGHLHAIAAFCDKHYAVPLHALVVNKSRGVPGGAQDFRAKGYFAAPGSSADLAGWREVDVPKCVAASHLPRLAPRIWGKQMHQSHLSAVDRVLNAHIEAIRRSGLRSVSRANAQDAVITYGEVARRTESRLTARNIAHYLNSLAEGWRAEGRPSLDCLVVRHATMTPGGRWLDEREWVAEINRCLQDGTHERTRP